MSPIVLFCGFKPINGLRDYLREQGLRKGQKLLESKHVYATKETYGRDISAKCHSQQGKHVYSITIELNPVSREIVCSTCDCRYGALGDCKHAAAVALFVNDDEAAACTSLPQAWRKPSRKPTLKDKAPISELFGEDRAFIKGKRPSAFSPSYILDHFDGIESPFTNVLRQLNKGQVDLECESLLLDIVEETVMSAERTAVDDLIPKAELPVYRALEVTGSYPKLKVSARQHSVQMTRDEATFFEENVLCHSAPTLCMATLRQSKCARWHRERKMRITSTMAHTILRTTKTAEELVESLLSVKRFSCDATRYGLRTEPTAREEFQKKTGEHVVEVGLLVHKQQTWLCGSPDGLFAKKDGTVLLEIKCPYSIRKSAVVDVATATKVSFVKYLTYVDNKLHLRNSHRYYTQVQLLMYVLNLKECLFFVYTSVDSVIVVVDRDDTFLDISVRCLEAFYYSHYLPALVKRYSI
ncbi:unnamed protein product [Ixodes hexagonus]